MSPSAIKQRLADLTFFGYNFGAPQSCGLQDEALLRHKPSSPTLLGAVCVCSVGSDQHNCRWLCGPAQVLMKEVMRSCEQRGVLADLLG
jgi:hypothetical protein